MSTDFSKSDNYHSALPDMDFTSEISTAALVRLLVKKGIVTSSEVLEAERQNREEAQQYKESVAEPSSESRESDASKKTRHHYHDYRKHSTLKNWASRKKWRRRLTTMLFGWHWRKSKHNYKTSGRRKRAQTEG